MKKNKSLFKIMLVIASSTLITMFMVGCKDETVYKPETTNLEDYNHPVDSVFGKFTKLRDETFVSNEIVSARYNVIGDLKNGVSYIATRGHSFIGIPGKVIAGNIKIELFIDVNDFIVGYKFVEYDHSKGENIKSVNNYLKRFIDTSIIEVETSIFNNKELKAGVTETTTNVIDVVLLAIKEVHKGAHPLYKYFGEFSKEADFSFIANEVVLEKHIITGYMKSGVSYVGNKEHQFDAYGTTIEGNIKIELFIDEDGIIVHYEYLEYKHSEGFKRQIDKYLNAFIGTKAVNITDTIAANKTIYAGATETATNVITPILLAIETEVYKSLYSFY